MSLSRHLHSLILPLVVTGIIPFFLVAHFHPFGLEIFLPRLLLQLLGLLLLCFGQENLTYRANVPMWLPRL